MPSSGVAVSPACIEDFNDMKLKHNQRCIAFVIEDKKQFVVGKKVPSKKRDQKVEFDEAVKEILGDPKIQRKGSKDQAGLNSCTSPFVLVWDLSVQSESEAYNDVLLFMTVCPDEGIDIREKTTFASSLDALKKALTGIKRFMHISSIDELNYEHVLGQMKSK